MRFKHASCFLMLLVLAFFAAACGSPSLTTTVDVTGGTIEGVQQDGLFVYKGIPFAAPPVGDLRWAAPAPLEPWTGVKKADAFGPACMQAANSMGNTAPVSEDCLYLNVWSPATKPDEKLPVIYWIYGGGFSGGSTSIPMYDGTGFAKKGVILVSGAYRVGPFGFLAHPELSKESGRGSGDYGLEDMIAGLEWVQKNIEKFGGDPSNVTIFGHSAGGMAVNMLAASPVAKGLFSRVICMSGGSFAPLQTSNQGGVGMGIPSLKLAESNGEAFLEKLGVADIKAARALSADDIQKGLAGPGGMRFRPDADGYVLPSDPYTIYQAGAFNDTPVLVGNTSGELGMMRGGNVTVAQFEQRIKSQYGPYADAILAVYPHATDAEAARSTTEISRDSMFGWNTWTWCRLETEKGKNRAYEYYFDYHPDSPEGVSGHGSDVPYAFQTLGPGPQGGEPKPEDLKLSDMISSYWVNFAKTGDPNGPGLPTWPAFSDSDEEAMVFDAEPSARPVPNLDKLKAFDAYVSWLRDEGNKSGE